MLLGTLLLLSAESAFSLDYRIIEKRPHNTKNFTQGLQAVGDYMIESSGHYGRSYITRYPLELSADNKQPLPATETWPVAGNLFAEGLTQMGERLYLLSWTKGIATLYRARDMKPQRIFRYRGEGWGITHDGSQLIMSNGSSKLQFRDPITFKRSHILKVRLNNKPVTRLNELDFFRGHIWANVWQENFIVAIDPISGEVKQKIDLSALARESAPRKTDSVLNGIAADPKGRGLWITGKNWPWLFLLEIPLP